MIKSNPRVLVAPLDWGLGHAGRCIPVAKALLKRGAIPVIAGPEVVRRRILQSLNGLEEIEIPGYNISYSRFLPAWFKISIQSGRIMEMIRKEKIWVDQIMKSHRIDGIISDNRYGIFHSKIPSVLMTHQLNLQIPSGIGFIREFVDQRIHGMAECFREVWIPDISDKGGNSLISGHLSFPVSKNISVRYIGLLSRFEEPEKIQQTNQLHDLLVIISGPQPQASEFFKTAASFAQKNDLNSIFIISDRSILDKKSAKKKQIILVNPDDDKFLNIMNSSRNILCRSGYSSIMDLIHLKRKAILVPTPGQTEQEYLASRMKEKYRWDSISQKKLAKASDDLFTSKEGNHHIPEVSEELLSNAIDHFLKNL